MGKISLVLLLFFGMVLKAQEKEIAQITLRSQDFANAMQTENVKVLSSFFEEDSAILPEYHPVLRGNNLILTYYKTLFEHVESNSAERKPFEIQKVGDHYIELGLFIQQYTTPEGNTFDYTGKYTTYWKMKAGKPYVWAFIWGASSYFEKEKVDFVQIITVPKETILPRSKWEKAIEEQRKKAYHAVLNEDLAKQMTSYSEDAVYMTYYDPPFKGKAAIRDYFKSHYNPSVKRDSLMTRLTHVEPMGEYALRFGEYYVEWIYEGERSFIEGKGLTLYKRLPNDSIQIYRQMINHNMSPTLVEDKDSTAVTRLLKHLDNQQLSVQDYLEVYDDKDLVVHPPGRDAIHGKEAFEAYLKEERQKGSVQITHLPIEIQRVGDEIHIKGFSEGIFSPTGSEAEYLFKTKNQMRLAKDEALKWKIQELSWQME